MSNQTEIQKIREIIRDFKAGKTKMNGYEFTALCEYLKSLENCYKIL